MTKERVQLFLDALYEDLEYTKTIIQLDIVEITSALNQRGYDFTREEVEEMGKIFREVANSCMDEDGELSEGMLDRISGGRYNVKAVADIIRLVGRIRSKL